MGFGRRCFAFFHPSMPDAPLVFVWVSTAHASLPTLSHTHTHKRHTHTRTHAPTILGNNYKTTQRNVYSLTRARPFHPQVALTHEISSNVQVFPFPISAIVIPDHESDVTCDTENTSAGPRRAGRVHFRHGYILLHQLGS